MQGNIFGPIRPLSAGARVALVAPSGIIRDAADVELAERNVRSFGWIPVLGEHVTSADAYLAGTDAERLNDLNAAIADHGNDAIWCVRGGYGAMRLLKHVDYAGLRARPRPVIGFSDITSLHAAIHRECGLVTFHGPTARTRLGPFARDSLERALASQRDPCGVASHGRVLRPGTARGRLAGGNLALVTALLGTPYSVDFNDAILVLEDIGEAVYRVDRMMRQLLLAGALQRCAAIVAGDFRPPAGETETHTRTVDDVLAEAADEAAIPCLAGAPFGHVSDQWTIPLGAMAELDTDGLSLHVVSNAVSER